MSNMQEVTIFNSGEKIILNLDMAYAVQHTDYKMPSDPEEKRAHSIIRFPDSEGEAVAYYVRETYDEVRTAMGFASQTPQPV